MQINNIDNQMSFTSRRSISRMLKLPANSQVAKDINKVTGLLVKELYKNKELIPPVKFTQLNKTALEKAQQNLGDRLILDEGIEAQIKDETLQVPFKDVIKFFDIISENSKKPISILIPKLNKIPSISNVLDNFKILAFPNATISDSILEIMGESSCKKAVVIPLRKSLEHTTESLNELIASPKNGLAEVLKDHGNKAFYFDIKNKAEILMKMIKAPKKDRDMTKILEQIQKLQEMFANSLD